MARTAITSTTIDLQEDNGNVLLSFIQGEQIEYPITLTFLTNAFGYTYEAVIAEGNNVSGDSSVPTDIKVNSIFTNLTVRVPPDKGNWNGATSYNTEDVISYGGIYYKLRLGIARVSATTPDLDVLWEVYVPNKVYIQFPKTIASDWEVKPTAVSPVHGFFELSITEPPGGIYQRTWKPVRGVVAIDFSPTQLN